MQGRNMGMGRVSNIQYLCPRSCCLGLLCSGNSRVDLFAILPSHTGRGSAVAAALARTNTNDCGMTNK